MINIETRRPVDMLPERSAESFRAWLDAHPGAEVICRDRGGCYAEGATHGAPLAIQVADRWHLLHNLAGAVERAVARHRSCLQEEPAQPEPGFETGAPPVPEGQRAVQARARHAEIHAAIGRGLTVTEISRALHLDRKTVRRYAAAADPGELSSDAPAARASVLDPHLPHLHQRWKEGCRNTDQLHQEIRARGYRGSMRTLRRHTAQLRKATASPVSPPRRRRRLPAGSSPRPASSPTPTTPPSPGSSRAARKSARPASWSATSPACSATAAASTSVPGPATPRPAPSPSYAALLKACARTGPPSPPASPCPTAPASSKATSTA